MYNSLCADMVMWISTLVGKITLHDSELEVCQLEQVHGELDQYQTLSLMDLSCHSRLFFVVQLHIYILHFASNNMI